MTEVQKGRIFISYRRADSQFAAGRIYDRLMAHFGEEAIFMDVEAIDGGVDFVKTLEDAVQACDVVLVVIGKQWLNIKDQRGERRLDNPEDFVRVEVATALDREIRVIPVLVEHALMPRSIELPENLKLLSRRNALLVNHQSFNADANRLIAHVERALEAAENSRVLEAQKLEEKRKEKAAELKRERERSLRQNQTLKLHTQSDTAISAQDWALAKQKLQQILSLDANDLQAQAKLELADEKLTALAEEEQAQRIAQEEALKEKAARTQVQAAQERADRLAREKRDAEEKARQATLRKERQQARIGSLTSFMKGKGALLGVGAFVFACLIFGGNYLINNLFDAPTPTATRLIVTEAPATVVLETDVPTEVVGIVPTAVNDELGVGSTMVSEKDGMLMVYVPAGEFQMGSDADDALVECQKFRDDCQRDWFTDEEPIHTVALDAYWIDQTEVTNAMYAKCVAAGACDEPDQSRSYTRDSYYGDAEFDDYPVIYVSWEDAGNYCSWAERRLPSEAEWEKAAGWNADTQSQRLYPWGDEFALGEANFCDSNCSYDWKNENYDDGYADTSPVGIYESGQSFYGAYDMAGNVWEWVADWYDVYPGGDESVSDYFGEQRRALRGGSWDYYGSYLRSAYRYWYYPSNSSNFIGFRCSRSP